MYELLQQIRQLMIYQNLGIREVSEKTGISKATLARYLSGQTDIKVEALMKIADALGLDVRDFFPDSEDLVKVPIYGTIACGNPLLISEEPAEYEVVAKAKIKNLHSFFLRTKGESMMPTIPDRAKVLIKPQKSLENGEIGAFYFPEENSVTLKRLRKLDGKDFLMPDNPNFEPIILGKDEPVEILGKAIYYEKGL